MTDTAAETEQPRREEDICRVCRSGPTPPNPLFHPCMCTGSMGHVHQECLLQWLKHSGKKYCEVCNHQFTFAPIYRSDMPSRLSVTDIVGGISNNAVRNVKQWAHLGFVAFIWLLFVPVCVCRIYKFLFFDSFWSIATLPITILSIENWFIDCVYGVVLVIITLVGFVGLVWLKDQVGGGKGPEWHESDQRLLQQARQRASRIRLQEMHEEMELSSESSTHRTTHPTRLMLNRQTADLKELIQTQVVILQQIMSKRFDAPLEEMQYREMELYHKLSIPQRRFEQLLKHVREREVLWLERQMNNFLRIKEGLSPEEFVEPEFDSFSPVAVQDEPQPTRLTQERIDEARSYGAELEQYIAAEKTKIPPKTYRGLYSSGGQFDLRDVRILSIFNSPAARLLTIGDRAALQGELDALQSQIRSTIEEHEQHKAKLFRILKVEEETDANMEGMSAQEQLHIKRIRDLQDELERVKKDERVLQHQQNRQADRDRNLNMPDRHNRWIPNILRNDEVQDMLDFRRQRRHGHIGDALAGLARDGDLNNELDNLGDLTWDKLLGLDGSFKFLEHVLWVILLNSAIIFALGYLPYKFGKIACRITFVWSYIATSPFNIIYAVLVGYIAIVLFILVIYSLCTRLYLLRVKMILGVVYISLKVGLLLGVEAGVFPLMCGWWIDICSFSLFGSMWNDRQQSLANTPGTITFFHWLAGMVYIFYFASLVMLLREVLRPGVLWFLRNLNDQNFHPVQEMINLPMTRHARRFIMSSLMFGTSVLLVLWIPCALLQKLWAGFLPYNLSLPSNIGPLHEIHLELLLLHFVLPTLLEHGNARAVLKVIVKTWAHTAAKIFSLQSYLLDLPQTGGYVVSMRGTVIREIPPDPSYDKPAFEGEPQLPGPGFASFKPYLRPYYFRLRMAGFLTFTIASAAIFSALILSVPVLLGRTILSLFGIFSAPEIYTAAIGFYLIWVLIKCIATLMQYATAGMRSFMLELLKWSIIGCKAAVAGAMLFIAIPLLLGLLCDLIVITPLRVPLDRHPVISLTTDWALGLLHLKCLCGAIWLGNSQVKRTLERVYTAGVKNIDLSFIINELAAPAIMGLSLVAAVPYVLAELVTIVFGVSDPYHHFLHRTIYPSIAVLIIFVILMHSMIKQFHKMYQKVKNDKYLIGQRLVNFGEPK